MLFNSFTFMIFLPVVFLLYWFIFKRLKWQNLLILMASYVFYGWWDWRFLILIIITSASSFASGLLIKRYEGQRHLQRAVSAANIVLNLGILGVFKYFNFFVDSLSSLLAAFGMTVDWPTMHIILPVGISFYTFQALSYSIDVYARRIEPTKDPIAFFSFISFFPQLVAGPIERATNLLPQMQRERTFDYAVAVDGLRQMLWGFFKKLVIADRISPVVSQIFVVNYKDYSGTMLFIGVIMYAIQIYCDFSGGIDITRGAAQMLGIELPLNFERPYFSKSVAEYWRRWHITLGAWMREYVFYPIMLSKPMSKLSKKVKDKYGQQKSKYVPSVITPFIVFILIGIWHGANWRYVAFGLYNAVVVAGSVALEPLFSKMSAKLKIKTESAGWQIFRVVRTFLILIFSKAIVKSPSLKVAAGIIFRMLTNFNIHIVGEFLDKDFDLGIKNWIVFGLALILLFAISLMQEFGIHIRKSIAKWNIVPRWLVYFAMLLIILIFGIYGPSYDASEFIYQAY